MWLENYLVGVNSLVEVKSLDELITAVASKGGTTEAAFQVFEKYKLGENLQEAIIRANERAKELSKS